MAIMVQVAVMYWMAGYAKYNGGWHDPDALLRVLHSDSYARPLAYGLREYSSLLTASGWLVLWGELVMPIAVFAPFWTKPIRLFAILAFLMLHLGIELTLTVGLFSWFSVLAWTLFLPDLFWNAIPFAKSATTIQEAKSPELEATSDRVRSVGPSWLKRIVDMWVVAMLVFVVMWNVRNVSRDRPRSITWLRLGNLTALRQRWDIFRMHSQGRLVRHRRSVIGWPRHRPAAPVPTPTGIATRDRNTRIGSFRTIVGESYFVGWSAIAIRGIAIPSAGTWLVAGQRGISMGRRLSQSKCTTCKSSTGATRATDFNNGFSAMSISRRLSRTESCFRLRNDRDAFVVSSCHCLRASCADASVVVCF